LIREDFFYRIRVIVINLPPLRDRKEDIPLLIDHFLQQYRKGAELPTIPARVMDALCMYHWPGNVRELQNELQRYLTTSHLELNGTRPAESISENNGFFIRDELPLSEAVEAFEQYYITRVLNQHRGQKSKTAVALGMNRKTLYKKLKKYGVL
jgi:DNA-binding NtrC family response regulator